MLSKEDNELLCGVGPGTAMGDLLRQYWMPILFSWSMARMRRECRGLIRTWSVPGMRTLGCPM